MVKKERNLERDLKNLARNKKWRLIIALNMKEWKMFKNVALNDKYV